MLFTVIAFPPAFADASTAFALFAGGELNSTASTNLTNKFRFSNDAVSAGQNLTASLQLTSAASNTAMAFIYKGSTTAADAGKSSVVDKYVWLTDVCSVSGTSGGVSCWKTAGCSISTTAYFANGQNTFATNLAERLVFATDTGSAGHNLGGTNRSSSAGIASDTTGYITGGLDDGGVPVTLNSTVKYSFALDSITAGGNLIAARQFFSGFGITTFGIVCGGINAGSSLIASCERYTYGTDLFASTTSMASNRNGAGCASTSSTGVAYSGGGLTSIEKFSMGGSTWSTSLSVAPAGLQGVGGACSVPGNM